MQTDNWQGKLDEKTAKANIAKVMGAITPSGDVSSLKDCDIVVEAIIEVYKRRIR